MDLHPADILIHIINIIVLFILLRVIVWNPVIKFLSARSERVKTELDDADSAKSSALALKAEYEQNIGSIEARNAEMLRDSQLKADEQAQTIIKDARKQADGLLSDAREKIENEKAQAVASASHEIAQLATELAARVLRREVSAVDTRSAVDDFFSETR